MKRTSALSVALGCLASASASAQLPDGVRVGTAHVVQDLTVFPILADAQEKVGRIVTLDAALRKGTAVVREQKNGAQVNRLEIVNRGNDSVYVLAGTVVKGGNQDRQVSQDFVVPPKKRIAVDAFCVEQGRWHGRRSGRSTGGRFGTMQVLAGGKVRAAGQYEKDQSKVWKQVAETFRPALLNARLMGIRGELQIEGEVVHVIARQLIDHSDMLGNLLVTSRDFR